MKGQEQLPAELVWQDDGHVGDVALTALADGQRDVVPEAAARHVGECAGCIARLGREALLSLDVGQALGEPAARAAEGSGIFAMEHPAKPAHDAARAGGQWAAPVFELRRDWPWPRLAVAAALVLAAAGALPGAVASASAAPRLTEVVRGVPLAAGAVVQLARGLGQVGAATWAVAWCVSAAVLLAVGVLIARRRPCREAVKGGRA